MHPPAPETENVLSLLGPKTHTQIELLLSSSLSFWPDHNLKDDLINKEIVFFGDATQAANESLAVAPHELNTFLRVHGTREEVVWRMGKNGHQPTSSIVVCYQLLLLDQSVSNVPSLSENREKVIKICPPFI